MKATNVVFLLIIFLIAIIVGSCNSNNTQQEQFEVHKMDSLELKTLASIDYFPKIWVKAFARFIKICEERDMQYYMNGYSVGPENVYNVTLRMENNKMILSINKFVCFFRNKSKFNCTGIGYLVYKERAMVFYSNFDQQCFPEDILNKGYPKNFRDEKHPISDANMNSDYDIILFEVIECDALIQIHASDRYVDYILY